MAATLGIKLADISTESDLETINVLNIEAMNEIQLEVPEVRYGKYDITEEEELNNNPEHEISGTNRELASGTMALETRIVPSQEGTVLVPGIHIMQMQVDKFGRDLKGYQSGYDFFQVFNFQYSNTFTIFEIDTILCYLYI